MSARTHLRLRYAAAALVTVPLGLAVRFAHLGLPPGVTKYGGSALWAAAIFWLVSVLLPSRASLCRAGLAWLLATAIEFFKLLRTPALDRFRLTLPGKLVLGRYFSPRDILAYALGIAIVALLEVELRRWKSNSGQAAESSEA